MSVLQGTGRPGKTISTTKCWRSEESPRQAAPLRKLFLNNDDFQTRRTLRFFRMGRFVVRVSLCPTLWCSQAGGAIGQTQAR